MTSSQTRDQYGRPVFLAFADASRCPHRDDNTAVTPMKGGYAVLYRPPGNITGPWLSRAWPLRDLPHVDHGEMMAIAEGLWVSLLYAMTVSGGGTTRIVTDSKLCLDVLMGGDIETMDLLRKLDDDLEDLVEAVIWLSHELNRRGWNVELSWIPGHGHLVFGHVLADRIAQATWTGKSTAGGLALGWVDDGRPWEESLCSRFPIGQRG